MPWTSLIKALEFSPKHKYHHLPACTTWHPVSGHLWMFKKTIQIKNLLRYLLFSRWYPELESAASRWHFQPHKQASGSPVGSLIIHADV